MPEPVFSSTVTTFGVGHGGFVLSPDEAEWWHVYHAKIARRESFRRVIQVQPMTWSAAGAPELGQPAPAGLALTEPSGTPRVRRRAAARWSFTAAGDDLADFDYYGHHQYFSLQADGVHLGELPEHPVNHFRSGEKLVLRDGDYSDLQVRAGLAFVAGSRAVGVLFRVTGAAVGFNAQRGYFAAVVPKTGRLVLGRTDGHSWTELGATPLTTGAQREHTLVVQAVGTTLSVGLEADPACRIQLVDETYPRGSVGIRVVNTHAVLSQFSVEPT